MTVVIEVKEFLSGLTLGTIIALTTLLIVSVAIAQPNPGHSADQIGPGTFSPGDYAFPNNLNVSGTLRLLGGTIEKHDDSRLNIYTDRDAYHSRAWIELWGADPSRGGELTLAGTYIDFRYNSTNSSYGAIGMRLSSQGNLGIGTTSPEWKLDVNGNAQIRGNYLRIGNGNPRAYVYADANNMIFTLPGGNNEFHFKDKDGNIRVRISNTGNLVASGYGSFNYKDNANQYSLRVGGGILLKSFYDPGSNPDSYITSTTSGGKIRFRNNADGVLYGWIGNNWYIPGKLGIGTNSPQEKLDVDGNIRTTGNIEVDKSKAQIILGAGQGGPHGLRFGDTDTNGMQMLYRTTPDELRWEDRNDGGSGNVLMSLNRNGDLKVGGDLTVNGWTLKHQGADFVLGTNDGRSVGSNTAQRALVHDNNDVLVLNYAGDFEGGVRVDSKMDMNGHRIVNQWRRYYETTSAWEVTTCDSYSDDPDMDTGYSLPAGTYLVIYNGRWWCRDDDWLDTCHGYGYVGIEVNANTVATSIRGLESPTGAGSGYESQFTVVAVVTVSSGDQINGIAKWCPEDNEYMKLAQRTMVIIPL